MTESARTAIIQAMTLSMQRSQNPDGHWIMIRGFEYSRRSAIHALQHPETPEGKVLNDLYASMIKTFGLQHLLRSFEPPGFPEPPGL